MKRKKGCFILGGIITLCFLMLTGVNGLAAPKPIKIGVTMTFSGIGSMSGLDMVEGIKMAVDEINASGGLLGRKVELLARDMKSDPKTALREATGLVLKEKVDFLIGAHISSATLAVSSFCKENKFLLSNCGSESAQITEQKGHRYIFRTIYNTNMRSKGYAQFVSKNPKWKKYWLMGSDYAFGRDMCSDFAANLKKLRPDVQIIGGGYSPIGATDHSGFITQAMAAKPDAIFLSYWSDEMIAWIKQAKGYGLFEKIGVIADVGDLAVAMAMGNEMPEGIAAVVSYVFYSDLPQNISFRERAFKRTGKMPSNRIAQGYWNLFFLAEAIKKAGTTNHEKVIDSWEGLTIDTPVGPMWMRPYDHQAAVPVFGGYTYKDKRYPDFHILRDAERIDGKLLMTPLEEVKKLRESTK